MSTIVICDDDQAALTELSDLLNNYYKNRVQIKTFLSTGDVLDYFNAGGDCDIAIVLKPASHQMLFEQLGKTEKCPQAARSYGFKLTERGKTSTVLFSELVYVEVKNHSVYFNLSSGKVLDIYGNLKDYVEILLSDLRMIQINRSFIINMEYIHHYENKGLILEGGAAIPFSRNFPKAKERCLKWISGQEV